MKTTFMIGSKEFKTERGLLNHVAKMFPNATAEINIAEKRIDLSIRGELAGALNMRTTQLVGKTVTIVNSNLSLV